MAETDRSAPEMRVVAICGSLRPESCTRLTIEIALDGAREVGASTHLIDLREYDLGCCDGREDEETDPEGVGRLRATGRSSPGIRLGAPAVHGG